MLNHYKFDFVCPMVCGGFCDNYLLAFNVNFCLYLLFPFILQFFVASELSIELIYPLLGGILIYTNLFPCIVMSRPNLGS